MSNLTKPKFTTLDISRKNYLLWILDEICRDWVWALLLLREWTQAQPAQYNEFVENEFKN